MNREPLAEIFQRVLDAVSSAPLAGLFLALVLLPLVGVPASPLWIALGIRSGTLVGGILAIAALLCNISLGYAIASTLGHGRCRAWLERRGGSLPQPTPGEEARWILLLRIAPGFPLFLQNYLLGLARVNFVRYLLLSLPIQSVYAMLFVTLGTSLVGSDLWRGLLAVSGIVAAGLLLSILRRRLSRPAE